MEDLRIPGIVVSIMLGLTTGTLVIGPAGLLIFGPIANDPDKWAIVGPVVGITFYLYCHFQEKKEKSRQDKSNKNE